MAKNSSKSKISVDLANSSSIPLSVFQNRKYTILESIVVYLKETWKLSFRKIAKLINRDLRYVHRSYYNAKQKQLITTYKIPETIIHIPVSIFTDKKFPALEALVFYLKENLPLNYHQIALLLNRNDRTIWTVYNRAKKKNVRKK